MKLQNQIVTTNGRFGECNIYIHTLHISAHTSLVISSIVYYIHASVHLSHYALVNRITCLSYYQFTKNIYSPCNMFNLNICSTHKHWLIAWLTDWSIIDWLLDWFVSWCIRYCRKSRCMFILTYSVFIGFGYIRYHIIIYDYLTYVLHG